VSASRGLGVAMTKHDDELAALKQEVAALKEALLGKEDKPEPKKEFVPKTDAEWIDEMHQMREKRMNFASNFHPDDLRAMEAAAPPHIMKGIREDRHAPTGPNYQGAIPSSQSVSNVHTGAGAGSGWGAATPLGPPPGVAQADRLMDHQDKL